MCGAGEGKALPIPGLCVGLVSGHENNSGGRQMDSFQQCLALGPVAIYLALLGAINLGRRPLVISGTRDAAVLGLALSGLVAVGPMALLFPDAVVWRLSAGGLRYAWAVLGVWASLYGLGLALVLLVLRPRLVIYNITADQLRPLLADLVERLDPEGRWAGDSLVLPSLGVQLHLEHAAWMRNVSLVSAGPKQHFGGWARLEADLAVALRRLEVPRNPRGVSLLAFGTVLAGMLVWAVARDPQAIARTLFDLLRLP